MGGWGSGNHWARCGRKDVVEDCLQLDANRWMREGILKPGAYRSGSWQWTYRGGGSFSVNYAADTRDAERPCVRLWYSWVWRSTKKEDSEDYHVELTTTRPQFGGLRWWFV